MSKITGIVLSEIEVQEDPGSGIEYRAFQVQAEDLENHFGPAFNPDSTQHEFFMFACEYVEIYNGEVVSTDRAKIDEVFIANESI